ncbi:Uncharacterised protein [Bordetella pertussis]|nr:Uncharacterised protein [Bordetella pertussis]
MHRFAVHRDLARGAVELQGAEAAQAINHGAARALDQGQQARLDLGQRERLGQVIVGAMREAGQLVVQAVAGGEHQHRQGGAPLDAQRVQHGMAIHAGQPDVQHHGVERVFVQQGQRRAAIVGGVRHEAAHLQVVVQVGRDGEIVLDDQDAEMPVGGRGGHGGGGARQACRTLPGLSRPRGSSATLSRFIRASSTALL